MLATRTVYIPRYSVPSASCGNYACTIAPLIRISVSVAYKSTPKKYIVFKKVEQDAVHRYTQECLKEGSL